MKLESICPLTTNSSSELFVFLGDDIEKINKELLELNTYVKLYPKEVPCGDKTIPVAVITIDTGDLDIGVYDIFSKYYGTNCVD